MLWICSQKLFQLPIFIRALQVPMKAHEAPLHKHLGQLRVARRRKHFVAQLAILIEAHVDQGERDARRFEQMLHGAVVLLGHHVACASSQNVNSQFKTLLSRCCTARWFMSVIVLPVHPLER